MEPGFDRITEGEVVAVVREALADGRGGRIITPNIDILRQAQATAGPGLPGRRRPDRRGRHAAGLGQQAQRHPAARAGGRQQPDPVTVRRAGPRRPLDLRDRRNPGDPRRRTAPTRAAARLAADCPGLRIAGTLCPEYNFERDRAAYAEFRAAVRAAQPDLVFVGLGFPKQEKVITRLRAELPRTWFIGCGAAVNFVAGDIDRAPRWMQRTGLEWAHRLASEPRRLASRYLKHDAPYALRLLAGLRPSHLPRSWTYGGLYK